MADKWLPRTDNGLLAFATNFSKHLTTDPAACDLDAADAAEYAALTAEFRERLRATRDTETRGPRAVFLKEKARVALEQRTRRLARVIRAGLTVTATTRAVLGLTPEDAAPRRAGVPAEPPRLLVESTGQRAVRVHIGGGGPGIRARKPVGCAGATLMIWIGPELPPPDVAHWRFLRNTGRTREVVTFANDLPPGTPVWFTAMWFNARFESGAAATPARGYVGSGGMLLRA